MKKLCIFAMMVAAIVTNASTIKWGASGAVKYGSTTLTKGKTDVFLVYLGENVSDWSSWSYSSDFESTKVDSTATTALGSVTASSVIVTTGSPIKGLDNIADNFAAGSSFGILYTTTQDGKDYYFQGGTFSYDTSSSNYSAAQDMYTFTSSSTPKATDTWTAVPEPSTAMLALAGLALLIKRRRA